MTLIKLDALGSTYESINGGIHRRAASIVGVPSLVRHIGLWDTTPPGVPGQAGPDPRTTAFYRYLDDLKSVITARANKSTIQFDKKDLPQIDPAEPVRSGTIRLLRFWWYGMRATIRVEFRTEYVMITSIIDLSGPPRQEYKPPGDPDNPQRQAEAKLTRLADLFDGWSPESEKALKPEFAKIAQFLQYDLWKRFEQSVLDAELDDRHVLGGNLGEVFADFRGVVTGSSAEELTVNRRGQPPREEIRQSFRRLFKLERRGERTRPLQHDAPPDGWARDSLQRLWPLIECDEYLRDYEFTVSGFLDGRALFVTALGPRLPDDRQQARDLKWTPVCNFIHAYTDDEWQLGRLVDRIMNLGTLRLAATIEIEHLIDVGATVDELTAAIRHADESIQDEIEKKAKSRKQEGNVGQPATSDHAMGEVRARFQQINDKVSKDILYRLERAEYYIEQFTIGAASLRVRRVEGFQQYGEMVARRMSGIFGYIQLLRSRMFDVDSRMSALSRAYTSLKAVKTDKQIERIQEFGETALIGVLIPYYLGAAVFHYAFHLQGGTGLFAWQLLLSFFALFVMGRMVWRMLRRSVTAGGLSIVSFFAAYLLAIWIVIPTIVHA